MLDVVLAAWVLGLLVDLTTFGTPIGLFAVAYAAAAALVFHVREAVFGDNPLTQIVMGLAFCLVAHGLAVLFMNLYVRASSSLGGDSLQALLLSACTAAVTPLMYKLFVRLGRWIVLQPAGRR